VQQIVRLSTLLEEKIIYYKQRDNETLVEWFQGQIEAYKHSLELAKSLVKIYNNL